jgi:hypothetical protein
MRLDDLIVTLADKRGSQHRASHSVQLRPKFCRRAPRKLK